MHNQENGWKEKITTQDGNKTFCKLNSQPPQSKNILTESYNTTTFGLHGRLYFTSYFIATISFKLLWDINYAHLTEEVVLEKVGNAYRKIFMPGCSNWISKLPTTE